MAENIRETVGRLIAESRQEEARPAVGSPEHEEGALKDAWNWLSQKSNKPSDSYQGAFVLEHMPKGAQTIVKQYYKSADGRYDSMLNDLKRFGNSLGVKL